MHLNYGRQSCPTAVSLSMLLTYLISLRLQCSLRHSIISPEDSSDNYISITHTTPCYIAPYHTIHMERTLHALHRHSAYLFHPAQNWLHRWNAEQIRMRRSEWNDVLKPLLEIGESHPSITHLPFSSHFYPSFPLPLTFPPTLSFSPSPSPLPSHSLSPFLLLWVFTLVQLPLS